MEQKKKSFYDISWKVTEPEYRADPALNYSLLAQYERNGRFNSLEHLFDKQSSPSLTFGSIVDCMMTDSKEDFDKRFMICDFPAIGDQLVNIAKQLYINFGQPVDKDSDDAAFGKRYYPHFNDIPDEDLASTGLDCGYYANPKYKNYRVKLIKENCARYYDLLEVSSGKEVISQPDYDDASACVKVLKESPNTKNLFCPDGKDGIERLYQLKFKFSNGGINYRIMADLIKVDYNKKTVTPYDLKTSSHPEWDFYKSFKEWNYQIQGRLYWRAIRDNMDRDPFFKDFKLEDYKFVVVNRKSLCPMVWDFDKTQVRGPIEFLNSWNTKYTMRDPYVIAAELKYYLDHPDMVCPDDGMLSEDGNSIMWFLENE